MQNIKHKILKTFDTLHASFPLIVIICLVHSVFVKYPKLLSINILSVFALGIKIFLYAGVYGTLVDLINERSPSFTFQGFFKNAKSCWPIYLFISLGKLFVVFLYANILKTFHINPAHTFLPVETLFLFILSILLIFKKTKPLENKKKHIPISETLFIIMLYLLNEIILNNNFFLPIDKNQLMNELIFVYSYIQFFTFIFFSNLILENYSSNQTYEDGPKELYLINPDPPGIIISIISKIVHFYPPIFVILRALTPRDYRIREFDKVHWRKKFFAGGKLVAITTFTANSAEAYKIAKGFKQQGSKVIMGGPHVSFFPDEALKYCDSVVIGDVEGVWTDVIRDYENNSLESKYYGYKTEESSNTVYKELLNSDPEIIRYYLETGSGCKFKCYFCTIPSLKGSGFKKRPLNEIIELIKRINNKKVFLFLDNNIYADPKYAIELFKELIPLKIRWAGQCSLDIAKDDYALNLAKKSGCSALLFGYEIYPESKTKEQKGKYSLVDEYALLSKKIKKAGILNKAHFIIGFEQDTLSSMFHLWKFCFRINPTTTGISVLTPLPGAQFFYDMLKEKRIIDYNWRNYDMHHLTFKHKNIKAAVFKFLYPVLEYGAMYTTCSIGRYVLLIFLIEGIIFKFKHL